MLTFHALLPASPSPAPTSRRRTPRLRPGVLAALCAACGPALAQQADATLEPVVISGSGVERRAFETPYAVSVVESGELRSGGLMVNLSETLARVPGLTANLRNNYAQDLQISSRGFGARSTFGVRGIRLYTDGIPASAPDGQGQVSNFDLAGAQRIEVLRGPFSALYGNSSGGVISLVSAPPKERAFTLHGDVGSDHTAQARVGIEGPLGNGFDIRAQLSHFQTENFRPQGKANRGLANVRLGWTGERDTVTVILNSIDQPAEDPLGLTRAQFDADPYQTAAVARQFNTRKVARQTQAGTQWKHRFEGAGALAESALTAYYGQRSVQQWQSIPPGAQAAATQPGGVIDFDRDYAGVDARLVWRWDVAQLVAGISAEQQDEDRRGFRNFTGPIGAPTAIGVTGALRRDETNTVRSTDAYAQGEVDLGANVSGTLGVRTGRLRVRSDDRFIAPGNPDDSGERAFSYTNPVAALQWKPSADLNLYISAGRGFESPTLNEMAYRSGGASGLNTDLKPQRSRQVELGAKWRDPGLGLGADLAVFRATTDDEIGVLSNIGGRSVFTNVGRTERKGVELAGRWQVTPALRTLLALTWLDAKYTDGANEGKRIAGTVKKSGYAEAAWRPIDRTELALEARGQGSIAVNDANTDFSRGVYVFALRASHEYVLPAGTLEVLARVDNVVDKVYAGSVIVNEGNQRFFEPGAPRSYLLSVRWRVGF